MRTSKPLSKRQIKALEAMRPTGTHVENVPGRWAAFEALERQGLASRVGPWPMVGRTEAGSAALRAAKISMGKGE